MWQFTRSTGKRFMQVGYTIDERRDPMLSSFAAAKLLGHNFRKLNSWPLAVTAYNHGVTGMRRAQRKKGSYERIFKEYRSRSFRFASRNFYSEFLAAREAAKNYRQYFGDVKLNSPRKTHAIELTGYVPLLDVARHLNLDPAELRALNPALRDPVFRGQKYVPRGYRLQLPDRNGTDWNQLMARLPQQLYRHKQKRSSIYTVRRGDTAGKIAKRHGVKLKDLIAANNLNRRATIYVNQNLRIPLPEPKSTRIAKQRKKTPSVPSSRASNRVPASLSAAVDPALQPSAAGTNSTAVARRHQPATISKDSGSVPEAGPASNPAQADPLALSQAQAMALNSAVLKLSLLPAIMQGHFAVDRVSTKGGKPVGHIRVEAEETLGHYAEWLKVSAGEIRRLNGLRFGRALHLSQRIKIPLHRVTKNEFEVKRFEYHQELAEDFFASYRVEKVWTYSIKKGDNIWTLSRREFEVPVWLIKQFNGHVDFGALVPSQKLIIPVVEKDA
jgi:membrane-bound lytic murein transglycosylase D